MSQAASRSRRAILAIAAMLMLLGTAAGAERAEAANPFEKPGMWIWYVSKAQGGKIGAIIKQAKRSGTGTLYIKSGDGTSTWSQFKPSLIKRFHRAGLDVCGWQYVYSRNPVAEAKVSAKAKARGADCFIIDAESEYEGEYAAADRYMRALRHRVGRSFPIALSSFPYVDYHPGLPYSVFLGPGGAQYNLPQMYWKAIGTSVRTVYEHTYLNNRIYKRPIEPVGQTYMNPGKRQILQFRRYAISYGGETSWWSWQDTNRREWSAIGRDTDRPIAHYKPIASSPTFSKGSRGDQVVWAQQLLNGAGIRVPVTGLYGGNTRRAVRTFQSDHGLKRDGVLGTGTWRKLVRNRPVRIRWSRASKRRLARVAGAGPARDRAPLSADLPARRNELRGAPTGRH